MKNYKKILISLLVSFILTDTNSAELSLDWSDSTKSNAICIQKSNVLTFTKAKSKKFKKLDSWYVSNQCELFDTNAISFEVKGDGSDFYASIFLSYNKMVERGYEAIFPLHATEWKKIIIPLKKFVQNDKVWSPTIEMNENTINLDANMVKFIAFGMGNHFKKFYPKECSFQVRNIETIHIKEPEKIEKYSKGLTKTKDILNRKLPLKILLLGDSITDRGQERSYGFFCAELLKEKFGSEIIVCNSGIGGHSVRGGTLVLERSFLGMENPDLVCIMYGANDCKSVNGKNSFNAKIFNLQLTELINNIRQITNGEADILILNGVPRLDKNLHKTTGEVEKIVQGAKMAAVENDCAFVDTFSYYLQLSAEDYLKYYEDTIHQREAGLKLIGKLMYNVIIKNIN